MTASDVHSNVNAFEMVNPGDGTVRWPWTALANAARIARFPLAHSSLPTGSGGRLLARLIPGSHGETLATTAYAITAAAQLLVATRLSMAVVDQLSAKANGGFFDWQGKPVPW